MSERLAVSATVSVLMMSIYVLFGGDSSHAPIGPDSWRQMSHEAIAGPLGDPAMILN